MGVSIHLNMSGSDERFAVFFHKMSVKTFVSSGKPVIMSESFIKKGLFVQYMKLDSSDLKLIELLKSDSRASVTSLAEEMGIARVTAHDRMVRLQREGIIRRFTVDIDAKAWGYDLRAFIFARCERGNVDRREVAQRMCELPYVVRCNVIAGDWDLLVEVVSPSMDSLGDAILDELSKVGGIASTQTMVSFYDYSGPASSLR
jgi:DNA-binding Lrp family transcriptional regulator